MTNEIHDQREAIAAAIKMAVGSDTLVVLEATAAMTGRVVVVELPDQVPVWQQLGQDQKLYTQANHSVAVIITPPWDSEGGRRLMNDVVGAMSAVAQLNAILAPEGAVRGTYTVADGQTLPCYRFTAQFPKRIEG